MDLSHECSFVAQIAYEERRQNSVVGCIRSGDPRVRTHVEIRDDSADFKAAGVRRTAHAFRATLECLRYVVEFIDYQGLKPLTAARKVNRKLARSRAKIGNPHTGFELQMRRLHLQ